MNSLQGSSCFENEIEACSVFGRELVWGASYLESGGYEIGHQWYTCCSRSTRPQHKNDPAHSFSPLENVAEYFALSIRLSRSRPRLATLYVLAASASRKSVK